MIITKKIMAVVALCMISAVSVAEGKIAVVNPQAAMLGTTAAKAKIDKLEKSADFTATKAKLDGIVTDVKALQALFQKEGATWPTEKQEENQKRLQSLNQDYQFSVKKLQTVQQELAQQIMQEMGPKAEAALKQIIESEKLGLVLNSQAAVHTTPEYDITAKLIELLNKAK